MECTQVSWYYSLYYCSSRVPISSILLRHHNHTFAMCYTCKDGWIPIVSNLLLALLVFGLSASVDVGAFRDKLKKK